MEFLLQQLLTGLASASGLFLVASGLTIIFGVTRIVNFADGSLFMLGAYLGVSLIGLFGGGTLGFWAGCCWRHWWWGRWAPFSRWRCCGASIRRPSSSSCWQPL